MEKADDIILRYKREFELGKRYLALDKTDKVEYNKSLRALYEDGWTGMVKPSDYILQWLYMVLKVEELGFRIIRTTGNLKVHLGHDFDIPHHEILKLIESIPCQVSTIRFSNNSVWVEFSRKKQFIELPENLPDKLIFD